MITSMLGFTYLRRSKTSMPDMPAMRMSSTATSMRCFCARLIAVGPSSAISISYSSLKITRSDCRGPSSSSTINNVPRRLRNVVLSPSTGLLLAINGSVVKAMSGNQPFCSIQAETLNGATLLHFFLPSRTNQPHTQHFQCLPRRDFLECPALIRIKFALNHRSKLSGQTDENRPHRFFFCSAVRPGNARDGNGKIRAELQPRAFGHFARHRFAHRTVSRQRFGANAEKFLLRFVVVTPPPAGKNRRRARHIRHAMRDATTGAGLRQRERFFAFGQKPDDDRFHFLIVKTVNLRAENFLNDRFRCADNFFTVPAARRKSPVPLPRPRAIADFKPGDRERVQRRLNFFLHQRLGDAARPQCAADKRRCQREFAPEQGHDKMVEHRAQLARRAGQHHQPLRSEGRALRVPNLIWIWDSYNSSFRRRDTSPNLIWIWDSYNSSFRRRDFHRQ